MQPVRVPSVRPNPGRRLPYVLAALGVAAVCGLVLVLGLLAAVPVGGAFREPSRLALTVQDRNGRTIGHRGVGPGGAMALSAMPEHLRQAFIAFEDRRFRSHHGVDLVGIGRAIAANLAALSWRQGASTITQQLVKNAYLTPEKTLMRKAQEAMIALWLERQLSKDEILERYLNTVYLGAGAYGVDAAARRFFDKPASALSLAEAAMLAGLAQAPSRTAPTADLEVAQGRAALVLDAMVATGAIAPEQAAAAKAAPATLAVPATPPAALAYAVDWGATAARAGLGEMSGTLTVRTTIDPPLQALATGLVTRFMADHGAAAGASEAALVAMQPDGRVLAVVGGIDRAASEFNRAVQARRQPGSLFKLFVYLAALRDGIRPDDLVEDAPITVEGWTPDNYTGRFHGRVRVREAFAKSYNAAAVRLQERVGRDRVVALARSMGLSGAIAPHPSLALGTAEVTLAEITGAFAAVASGNARVRPRIVETVTTPSGLILTPPAPPQERAPWPRATMLDLLRSVVDDGTGGAARLPVPAYGKTGTTQENRDAWFVGFSGDLVVGVWIGNDDGRPMSDVTGGGLPARLWRSFMVEAAKVPVGRQFAPDAGGREEPPEPIAGPVAVVDTGTLRVDGRRVRLLGVVGTAGLAARDMADYIGDREVECAPAAGDRHRCEVAGWDLSEVVLFNGGGRATPDAPDAYVRAERKARAERRGIWAEGG